MLEKYTDQILGAILTGIGAVLFAVLAWLYKRANEWWRRPRIAIEIGNGDGHIYENVLIKTYSTGGSTTSTERHAIFVRARVTNKEGMYRTPDQARGCVGYLAGLERWDDSAGSFVPTKYQDFLRLEWSFNKEVLGMDLLPGIPVWLDVCYVLPAKVSERAVLTSEEQKTRTMRSPPQPKPTMEPPVLKLASNPPVNRYGSGFELPGMYRVKVQVSGENFGAHSIQFYVLVIAGSSQPEILYDVSWRERLPALAAASADYVAAGERFDQPLAVS
jgi:hypothetical protein